MRIKGYAADVGPRVTLQWIVLVKRRKAVIAHTILLIGIQAIEEEEQQTEIQLIVEGSSLIRTIHEAEGDTSRVKAVSTVVTTAVVIAAGADKRLQ